MKNAGIEDCVEALEEIDAAGHNNGPGRHVCL